MKLNRNSITKPVICLLETMAKKATYYQEKDMVVTATFQHKPRKYDRSTTIVLTFGKPNYLGRKFIKACQKAGEPFPVKKVQLKFYK